MIQCGAKLLRVLRNFADGRVLFQYNAAVAVSEYFERIAFANAERPADFFGNNNAAELIDPSHNTSCLQGDSSSAMFRLFLR